MPVSSDAERWPLEPTSACRDLLGWIPARVERIGGGRNSRVFRVGCEAEGSGPSASYVLKHYVRHPGDPRDRLATEFGAYRFLWDRDVRAVPEPIAMSPELSVGIYEHIDGRPVMSDVADERDVDASVAFLAELRRQVSAPGSDALGMASEACFSVQELLDSLDRRMARLGTARDPRVLTFIAEAYAPAHREIAEWCRARMETLGLAGTRLLPQEDRTLSPSDFGFHNAIRRPSGELAFVDFEYFGWDDPAKTLVDWLLHPGMVLRDGLRQRFASAFVRSFDSSGDLARRASIVYPLFGLKWCLILLNEFVPDDAARRSFAATSEGDPYVGPGFSPAEASLEQQLEKAEAMLARVQAEYRDNPYLP